MGRTLLLSLALVVSCKGKDASEGDDDDDAEVTADTGGWTDSTTWWWTDSASASGATGATGDSGGTTLPPGVLGAELQRVDYDEAGGTIGYAVDPQISGDATAVAFLADRPEGFYAGYHHDLAAGTTVRIGQPEQRFIDHHHVGERRISDDGDQYILWENWQSADPTGYRDAIHLFTRSTGNLEKLPNGEAAFGADGAWLAPDGASAMLGEVREGTDQKMLLWSARDGATSLSEAYPTNMHTWSSCAFASSFEVCGTAHFYDTGAEAIIFERGPGIMTRITEANTGGFGMYCATVGLSHDASRALVFCNLADDLTPGDGIDDVDYYVVEPATNTTKQLSIPDGPWDDPVMSRDGRFVFVTSDGSDGTSRGNDIYRWSFDTAEAERISLTVGDAVPDRSLEIEDVSFDGSVILFQTFASNVAGGHTEGGVFTARILP